MRVFYVLGNDGAGKTTLTSIIAYNLFLRNYQVGILDLTDRGKGYFFRFGACDFFALGDGSLNIPQKLLVTLQDIGDSMRDKPQLCLHALPLMPGLRICLTAPAARQEKSSLARTFLKIYQEAFDIIFVEMQPPLHLLCKDGNGRQNRVLVICSDVQEDWPGKDSQLSAMCASFPQNVKVVLNKQRDNLVAATRFVEKNKLGADFILQPAGVELVNSTVMEMCKQVKHSRFLQQLVPIIYGVMLE